MSLLFLPKIPIGAVHKSCYVVRRGGGCMKHYATAKGIEVLQRMGPGRSEFLQNSVA